MVSSRVLITAYPEGSKDPLGQGVLEIARDLRPVAKELRFRARLGARSEWVGRSWHLHTAVAPDKRGITLKAVLDFDGSRHLVASLELPTDNTFFRSTALSLARMAGHDQRVLYTVHLLTDELTAKVESLEQGMETDIGITFDREPDDDIFTIPSIDSQNTGAPLGDQGESHLICVMTSDVMASLEGTVCHSTVEQAWLVLGECILAGSTYICRINQIVECPVLTATQESLHVTGRDLLQIVPEQRTVLGFAHTHPPGIPAVPSQSDRIVAQNLDAQFAQPTVYPILQFNTQKPDIRVYGWQAGELEEIEIEVEHD